MPSAPYYIPYSSSSDSQMNTNSNPPTPLGIFSAHPKEIRDLIYSFILSDCTALGRTSKAMHEDTKDELLRQHPVYKAHVELNLPDFLYCDSITQPPPAWAVAKLRFLKIFVKIIGEPICGLYSYTRPKAMIHRLVDRMEKPKACCIEFWSLLWLKNMWELPPQLLMVLESLRRFEAVEVRLPRVPPLLGDWNTSVAAIQSVLGPRDGDLGPRLAIVSC